MKIGNVKLTLGSRLNSLYPKEANWRPKRFNGLLIPDLFKCMAFIILSGALNVRQGNTAMSGLAGGSSAPSVPNPLVGFVGSSATSVVNTVDGFVGSSATSVVNTVEGFVGSSAPSKAQANIKLVQSSDDKDSSNSVKLIDRIDSTVANSLRQELFDSLSKVEVYILEEFVPHLIKVSAEGKSETPGTVNSVVEQAMADCKKEVFNDSLARVFMTEEYKDEINTAINNVKESAKKFLDQYCKETESNLAFPKAAVTELAGGLSAIPIASQSVVDSAISKASQSVVDSAISKASQSVVDSAISKALELAVASRATSAETSAAKPVVKSGGSAALSEEVRFLIAILKSASDVNRSDQTKLIDRFNIAVVDSLQEELLDTLYVVDDDGSVAHEFGISLLRALPKRRGVAANPLAVNNIVEEVMREFINDKFDDPFAIELMTDTINNVKAEAKKFLYQYCKVTKRELAFREKFFDT